MARLAEDRNTHLTPGEIAGEALRQFDAGSEPTIRSLAKALHVAPSAIYHHYSSRGAIVQAAVELVWGEVIAEGAELVPKPFQDDPVDVLVGVGVATRRVWYRHYRVAPYMAATPESNEFLTTSLGLFGALFERLGLEGDEAAASFHSYGSFMLGAVLFASLRRLANERLAAEGMTKPFHTDARPQAAARSTDATRRSLDEVMEISSVDPDRDEQLFAAGLRRLVLSFAG